MLHPLLKKRKQSVWTRFSSNRILSSKRSKLHSSSTHLHSKVVPNSTSSSSELQLPLQCSDNELVAEEWVNNNNNNNNNNTTTCTSKEEVVELIELGNVEHIILWGSAVLWFLPYDNASNDKDIVALELNGKLIYPSKTPLNLILHSPTLAYFHYNNLKSKNVHSHILTEEAPTLLRKSELYESFWSENESERPLQFASGIKLAIQSLPPVRSKHYRPIPDLNAVMTLPKSLVKSELKDNFYAAVLADNTKEQLEQKPQIYSPLTSWNALCSAFMNIPNPIILICGERNMGKSALATFTANFLTRHYNCVHYMELDSGQPELGPTGVLGLYEATKETILIGTPWTRTHKPMMAHFFGAPSAKNNPLFYLQCVSSLYHFYLSLQVTTEQTPLIVNTPGWIKGMGNYLLQEVIKIIQPTNLVIISNNSNTELINIANLRDKIERDMKTHYVLPPVTKAFSVYSKLTAAQLREIALSMYFEPEYEKHLVQNQNPYSINFNRVQVQLLHSISPSQLLFYLNGAIVGIEIIGEGEQTQNSSNNLELYSSTITEVPYSCNGLGIIRSIDKEAKILWIVTPLQIKPSQRIRMVVADMWFSSQQLIRHKKESKSRSSSSHLSTRSLPYLTTEVYSASSGAESWSTRTNLRRKSHISEK